jgi:gamma-glutamyl phosphate reductase
MTVQKKVWYNSMFLEQNAKLVIAITQDFSDEEYSSKKLYINVVNSIYKSISFSNIYSFLKK